MFIERMLSLMQEKGITRRKMATDVGIGINQIKYWQDNGNVPNALTIEKIADRLGTTPDYLLGKTDKKEKPTADDDGELSELLSELEGIITDMTENQKDALLDYAKYLKSKE